MKDLEGRVAVVAGATRGAGRSTTNFFSGNGVSVAAMCAESHQHCPRSYGHWGKHRQILFPRLPLGVKFS